MEAPRRNLKQELLVAAVALVILASAIGLAVVLTGDSLATLQQTPTLAALAVTSTPTATPEPASATPSPGPLPSTATDTATEPVSLPPTATPPGPAAPSSTPAKPSPVPPGTTAAEPSPTARPTRTPVPRITSVPTGTALATASPTRTATPRRTPSPTAAPPRATNTPAPTITRTPSPTPTSVPPTPTPFLPGPTVVLATPITPTVAAAACTPPDGWRPYTIRSGENLFRISLRSGVPLAEMQRVNCIVNPANIIAGQVIYVPPAFFYSSAPTSPIQTQDVTSSIPRQSGCGAPGIQIAYPAPGAILTGRFAVTGSATLGDNNNRFSFYKLELRAENETTFHNVGQASQPVVSGTLATIDPAAFGPGNYQLKLTVVDVTGNYPQPCAIRVTFR